MSVVVPKNKIYVQPKIQPINGEEEIIILPGETVKDRGAQTFQADVGDFPEDWDREEKISYTRAIIQKYPELFVFINLS